MIQESAPLTAVFSEVLANMAFLFTEPPGEAPAVPASWLNCSIQYRGPKCGRLVLRTTPQFALSLAANLLNVDPETPEALGQGQDALKELVNVFCGQLLTTIYGREKTFDLSIPAISEAAAPLPSGGAEEAELYVDGQPIRLTHVCES